MARGKRNADQQLLLALACGASDEQAAVQSGLSVRTVHRRKQEPDFKRQLRGLQSDMRRRTLGILTAASVQSAATLVLLQKDDVPSPTRLGAANSVLAKMMKLGEHTEFEERLGALEERLAADGST
jgi:hypothetical protein